MSHRALVIAVLVALVLAPGRARAQEVEPKKDDRPAPRGVVQPTSSPIHGLEVKRIDGTSIKLNAFRGQTCLIVNVASRCGLTPQYEGLEKLYQKYKDRGFVVLGFPADNFGHQEPGTDAEIAAFCTEKYAVTFPMFAKISVHGDDQAPLYRYLTAESPFPGAIKWNFQKFLIDGQGKVLARFDPKVKPDDPAIASAIEASLAARLAGAVPAVPTMAPVPATPVKDADFIGGDTAGADALTAALAAAAKNEKVVFLHFSADWCGWCKKLEAFMARTEIAPIIAQDFVPLKITTDHMRDGEALLKKYAEGKSTGIPFIVFLKGDGTVLARSFDAKGENLGYPSSPEEINVFMTMFETHARRATADQRALVRKTLESLGSKPPGR